MTDIANNVIAAQLGFAHALRKARARNPEQNPGPLILTTDAVGITAACQIGAESVKVTIKATGKAQTPRLLREVAKRFTFAMDRSR